MLGTRTLADLYLGSEPISVTAEDDSLHIDLANGNSIDIPLSFIGALGPRKLSPEAKLLILNKPPQIDHIHVTDSALNVYLKDGRLLSSPLSWFPRLMHGTAAERNHYELLGDDDVIHWPDLDEDIDLAGLFVGGKSRESERSLSRWMLQRERLAVRESSPSYATEDRKTAGVEVLVRDALQQIPEPYGEDIIEDVCLVIENDETLLRRYHELAADLRHWVVNNWIGQYTKLIVGMETVRLVDAKRSKIIKSYTKLR
ncbi:MAG: DUF2442 domain-containing protein [Caldilineaceae bacterium]